ncbi:MAG: caspase family protein [Pseudomonadota bacterium]
MTARIIASIVLLTLTGIYPAFADDKRVALLIGNSDYAHVSQLPNPANDARDVSAALGRLGFDVTLALDLDYRQMRLALRDFGEAAANADIAMIYFAGHGVEIDKVNYLIPVNAELRSDRDVEFEAIRLDAVISTLEGAKGVRIVLLDACRNNPFLASMQRTSATRSIGRGLSRIDPGGVLVGYAARGGTLALDGTGRNSPYAEALLATIEEPGLEIGKMFRRVRDLVLEKTDGFQEPFTYGSLPGDDIYLIKPQPAAAATSTPAIAPAPTVLDQMLEDFDQAEKVNSLRRWNNFLENYGELAENRLVKIAQRRQAELEKDRDRRARAAQRPPLLTPEFDAKGHAILDREQRKLVQKALSYMGHYEGPIDGDLGPQSRRAITAARLSAGLPVGTHVDRLLLLRLPDVAATDALKSKTARYYKAEELPPGLDSRLDKALRYFDSPFGRSKVKFDYFQGNLYLAVNLTYGDFDLANTQAIEAGGHLATIHSSAENQFIIGLFSSDSIFYQMDEGGFIDGPMIGLYQQEGAPEPSGGWTWVTGEPVTYTAWSPGNPDNYQNKQERVRFFLPRNMARPGAIPRFWDDAGRHMIGLGYILEID